MKYYKYFILVLLVFTLSACDRTPEEVIIDRELNTDFTDTLAMDFTYDGLSFLDDGVGEVTLEKCTDGDTAVFKDGAVSFPVRFLGINTPESTNRIDPWGKTASEYTCDKLTNATTIVLESEGSIQDGYDRYLAWVWYDGRLINMELVEQSLTYELSSPDSKYTDIMYQAELATQVKERRIWGELDPNFDYSLEGVQVTIKELATNTVEYETSKIVVTGTIAYEVDGNPYIVDDEGYGIYMYLRENSVYIAVGNKVTIEGLNLTYYPDKETGSPQLVNFSKRNIVLISENNEIPVRDVDIIDLTTGDLGSYIQFQNITVTDIYLSPNTGDYTVTCEDALGNEVGLHIQNVDSTEFNLVLNDVLDVTGPLSRYEGQYQLELSNLDTVVEK